MVGESLNELCNRIHDLHDISTPFPLRFSDPNLTDEAMLEVFMDIFEARASWRKLSKTSA